MFDTDNTSESHFETNNSLQVAGETYKIYEKIPNKIKAEAYFLKLKIDELKNNSFSFFMPTSFKIYTDRFEQIHLDYPEYII